MVKGGKQFIERIIFDFAVSNEHPYREIRWLMAEDGSKTGRFIRVLAPGEETPGLENTPWLKEGE